MPAPNPPSANRRRTSTRVRVTERLAQTGVTVGGLGVIFAVLAIMVFLVLSVTPLFERGEARLREEKHADLRMESGETPLFACLDEYTGLLSTLGRDGVLTTIEIDSGRVVDRQPLTHESVRGQKPTAWSFARAQGAIAFGFADGRVQLGRVGFEASYLQGDEITPEVRALAVGGRVVLKSGYAERVAIDQYRFVRPLVDMREPAELSNGAGPVRLLDYCVSTNDEYLAAVREDGKAVFNRVRVIRPLGGGPPRTKLSPIEFEVVGGGPGSAKSGPAGGQAETKSIATRPLPDWLFATIDGANIYMLWKTGEIDRYVVLKSGDDESVAKAESLRLTSEGEHITAASMLLGAKSLVVGTDRGRVLAGFAARDEGAATIDRRRYVSAHTFLLSDAGAGAITALGISQRDRSLVVGDDRGGVFIRNVTSNKVIADLPGISSDDPASSASPVSLCAVDIAPKNNAVLALDSKGGYRLWDVDPKHAEASFSSLFGRVWYEGETSPSFNYQSSSGEDTAEPKLSVTPLLWGTLKSTFYAMIFAVPLAILAAIYTSEILHPDVRSRVKPIVEAMASLPSVVLGFLAALIVAPFARDWLPSILVSLFVIPASVLLAAYVWQMMPIRVRSRLTSGQHFVVSVVILLLSVFVCGAIGPLVERGLFRPSTKDVLVLAGSVEKVDRAQWPAWVGSRQTLSADEGRKLRVDGLAFRDGQVVRPVGTLDDPKVSALVRDKGLDRADIRLWLDGVIGGPFPGWLLLMIPVGVGLSLVIKGRLIEPVMLGFDALRFGPTAAVAELVKFIAVCLLSVGLASLLALMLTAIGADPRDSVFGPFNQRNSLVVGLIMGFAIIPIIFTVSEDALSSVSQSLRSASYGAGATRWQTAIRVVLPVAASGIFSACMIGLGRAAGETMIVLMATGNTPSMDLSMFSGFRSLSANIAVELPEAANGSTHYRVLFLCGLVLFVITFVVNTLAEFIRQRFRKRAAGL